ncbi:MAG: putative lipoprotein with Yx(FWY)xxD motif, partial [Halioglobus sp.]
MSFELVLFSRDENTVSLAKYLVILYLAFMACFTHAAGPIYGDGDVVIDGSINISDYLRASRIVLGEIEHSELELSHGDLYPPAAPDGVINLQDLLLLQLRLGQQANYLVETLGLFADGPATLSADVGGSTASTTLVVDGYTGPGASVTNNPNFIDPDDSTNTLWYVSVNGGIASAYLSTSDLGADDILDSGFDLSGDGAGQLVFDLKVNSLSPGATLTVKIDSGALAFGQVALAPQSLTVGSWQRVAINFADLLAGPGPGVDFSNVVNVFVIEVTGGDADFYLDNIFVSHSCPPGGVCNATIKTKPIFSDIDGDGVEDSLDQCPATPTATVVDASGCPLIVSLLSGTATASSFGPAGGAGFAVDGNIASRWESAHGIDPSWIVLDLGANYTLSEVSIRWEAANAASYEFQGSADNVNWILLASRSGGVFGDRTDSLSLSGTYRYVRMYGLSRSSPYGYSIWEMEVYGSPASDEDADGVDDIIDLCPGTLSGGSVDARGCIFIDTDNDGVRDSLDQCPSSPPVTLVDATGCTVIVPVNEVASINGILAGGEGSSQPGFSLYIFDNDPVGTSTCNGSCASYWPPLLVADGGASGVSDLGTIVRSDGSLQASYQGRPLYFYIDDAAPGDTTGDAVGGVWGTVAYSQIYTSLFNSATLLEPVLREDTPAALITRLADRARDRHAREDQFQIYDHYLSFYWEHRTAEIEIVDTIGKGGSTVTFNVTTEWPLNSREAELRFFHLTAAIYANNGVMSAVPGLDVPGETRRHYTRSVSLNPLTGMALRVGDRMEFELSQFLTGTPNGRDNYYGTAILYIVGQGVVPWEAQGLSQNSFPMPAAAKLGGDTTLNYQYSDEPDNHFMQMPTNLSN